MAERPIPVRLFRPVEWVADADRSSCYVCATNFTLTNRRHHCRLCGEVVCASCSAYKVFIRNEDSLERACKGCFTLAQNSYKSLAAKKSSGDPVATLTPPSKVSAPSVSVSPSPVRRKPRASRFKSSHRITLMVFLVTLAATALQYDWIGWAGAGFLGFFIVCMEFSSLGLMFYLRKRMEKREKPKSSANLNVRTDSSSNLLAPTETETVPVRNSRAPFQGKFGPVPKCEYDAKIQASIETLLDCSAAQEGVDGWTKFGSKSGVDMFSKPGGDTNYYMGKGIVDGPPRAVLDILNTQRVETTRELDEFFDRDETLERFSPHTSVVWNLYKPVMFVAARDFLLVGHVQVMDDGSVVYLAQSIPDHPKCPRLPSVTRGTCFIGGWHITPLPGNRSMVVYVTNASLGGSVPLWLINKISQSQPMQIAGINKMLKKRNLVHYQPGGSRHELRNGMDFSCPKDVERSLML